VTEGFRAFCLLINIYHINVSKSWQGVVCASCIPVFDFWCFFSYSMKNRLVALLEPLFAGIFLNLRSSWICAVIFFLMRVCALPWHKEEEWKDHSWTAKPDRCMKDRTFKCGENSCSSECWVSVHAHALSCSPSVSPWGLQHTTHPTRMHKSFLQNNSVTSLD